MKSLPTHRFRFSIKDTYLENLLPRFHEERIKQFLTLISTLLAICIFGLFAINPTLTTIAQLKKQLSDSEFVNQRLIEKIANLSTLQQSYAKLQESLPSILDAVPSSPNIPLFVAQTQAVAQKTHFELDKVQTLPVELTANVPTTGYLSFGFVITGNGTNNSITDFISLLQSFNRLVTVDEFSISRSQSNPNNFQLNIRGKTYFKKT